jgi:hypothetical protein
MRTYSDKETVTISAPEVTVEYNKNANLTITLIDQNNKTMAGKTIALTLNNANYTLTSDENGTAALPINLEIGDYIAEISYAGNDNYAPAKANATVKVTKVSTEIAAPGASTYLKTIASGYKYSVTLKDSEGKGISSKEITIAFNGKTYKATTNANGVATFTLKASKTGSLKATVNFAGDNATAAATKTATIKITKEASKITAAKKTFKAKTKTKKYTITLKSNSGKAISKAKVTLKVKGKTYKATTNSKGKATFKITKLTKKGKYTATVKFAGNTYYTAKTAKPKITIK